MENNQLIINQTSIFCNQKMMEMEESIIFTGGRTDLHIIFIQMIRLKAGRPDTICWLLIQDSPI